jgi:hypothetical protein
MVPFSISSKMRVSDSIISKYCYCPGAAAGSNAVQILLNGSACKIIAI